MIRIKQININDIEITHLIDDDNHIITNQEKIDLCYKAEINEFNEIWVKCYGSDWYQVLNINNLKYTDF